MSAINLSPTEAMQQIRNLHQQGMSVRAIGNLVGMGKSTVHDVITGKLNLSSSRAETVGERLETHQGMRILTETGYQKVMPLSTRDSSLLGKHGYAVGRFLKTGDATALEKLTGKSVKTTSGIYQLVTDRNKIKALAKTSALDVDEIVIGGSPGRKRRR
ncbi:MAG: hypothetical protein ACYDBB_02140 [Armatimonadota bacterium]